jgi:hypothetical protein
MFYLLVALVILGLFLESDRRDSHPERSFIEHVKVLFNEIVIKIKKLM